MANAALFDDKAVQATLSRLTGDMRAHLARSMGVAGGKVFRDTAKALVPVDTGRLRESLYLAFKDKLSYGGKVVYGVTWRKNKGQMGGGAAHGYFIEFGHWQKYVSYIGKDGNWYTDKSKPLDSPKWIAAQPFLAPAFDGAQALARAAMVARGKQRLPELLREARVP